MTFADLYHVAPYPWRLNKGINDPIQPAAPDVLSVRAVSPPHNGDGLTVIYWQTRRCLFAEEYEHGRFVKRIPLPLGGTE